MPSYTHKRVGFIGHTDVRSGVPHSYRDTSSSGVALPQLYCLRRCCSHPIPVTLPTTTLLDLPHYRALPLPTFYQHQPSTPYRHCWRALALTALLPLQLPALPATTPPPTWLEGRWPATLRFLPPVIHPFLPHTLLQPRIRIVLPFTVPPLTAHTVRTDYHDPPVTAPRPTLPDGETPMPPHSPHAHSTPTLRRLTLHPDTLTPHP